MYDFVFYQKTFTTNNNRAHIVYNNDRRHLTFDTLFGGRQTTAIQHEIQYNVQVGNQTERSGRAKWQVVFINNE